MELKFSYIIKKIKNKIEIKQLRKYVFEDNLYLQNIPENKQYIKKILLYFPDYQMMHLGDHLFFEPLANNLKEAGYELYIEPAKVMEFYFLELGYKLSKLEENTYDLVISRIEFYPILKNSSLPILYIEIANIKIQQPLCVDIIVKTNKVLEIEKKTIKDTPKLLNASSRISDELLVIKNSNDNYIVFNNYIDSGSFRVFSKHFQKIKNFTEVLKRETGYKVIHTGSKNDKDKDKEIYDFVDIDLRGKTSIKDLFELVQFNNILINVSFDAFQMHLFMIKNKKSYILFRGRFTQKASNLFINYFNPPFNYNGDKKCIVEYIL